LFLKKNLEINLLSLKQKDELIINLNSNLNDLRNDLLKANESLLNSESRIVQLENDKSELKLRNENLQRLQSEANSRILMQTADHEMELNDKDKLVIKLRQNIELLKEKCKNRADQSTKEISAQYEEQLKEKQETIQQLNDRINKLNQDLKNKNEEIKRIKVTSDELSQMNARKLSLIQVDLDKANFELEKTEQRLISQTDDYETEIDKLTFKLKEKDETIKSLIASSYQKDQVISTQTKNSIMKDDILATNNNNKDTKQIKIEGLLKKIQEKNHEIETLRQAVNSNNNSLLIPNNENDSIKLLIEHLDKEVSIYKNLNKKQLPLELSEICQLRNELIDIIMKLSQNNSNNNQQRLQSDHSSSDSKDGDSDSGLQSVQSTATTSTCSLTAQTAQTKQSQTIVKTKSSLGMPRIVSSLGSPTKHSNSQSSMSSVTSSIASSTEVNTLMNDLNFQKKSHEQLVSLLQKANNDNCLLKRQVEILCDDVRTPKITELHNELTSVRAKLEISDRFNEYLRKQVEIYHITTGNSESLLEMATKYNDSKLTNASSFLKSSNESKVKYEKLTEKLLEAENRFHLLQLKVQNHLPHLNTNLNSYNRYHSLPNIQQNLLNDQMNSETNQMLDKLDESQCDNIKHYTAVKINLKEDHCDEYCQRLFYIYKGFKQLKTNCKYLKEIFGHKLIESFDNISEEDDEQLINNNSSGQVNLVQKIFSSAILKIEELSKNMAAKDEEINELSNQLNSLKNDNSKLLNARAKFDTEFINYLSASSNNKINKCLSTTLTNFSGSYAVCREDDFLLVKNILIEIVNIIRGNENEKNIQNIYKIIDLFRNAFCITNLITASSHKNSNDDGNTDLLVNKLKKSKEEIKRLKTKIQSQNSDIEEALFRLAVINHFKTFFFWNQFIIHSTF
jgi:hypothetical protein